MSEPMSSVEIEDVLSSIRRLVSDDLRPQARTLRDVEAAAPIVQPVVQPVVQTVTQAVARADKPSDKLLLTPALRIVPEPEPEAKPEVAQAPTAFAVDESEGVDGVFHTIRRDQDVEAGFVHVDDGHIDEGVVVSQTFPLGSVVPVTLPVSDSYDDDGADAPVGAATIQDEIFAAADLARDPVTADGNWADEAEAAVRAELEQDTASTAYARFLEEPEDATFDEAAMRELVRDIIREELQGALGERITRNVRKLVRAEIARALAVRDFE